MAKKATRLHPRKHKGMVFYPVKRGNKRELKSLLVDRDTTFRLPDGEVIRGRLADKKFFRIYKHKNQGWTLYISKSPKYSHGGLRVRGSKKSSNPTRKTTQRLTRKAKDDQDYKVREILSEHEPIQFGPHSGKFKNKKTGDILTETQLRLLVARRGK